MPIRVDQGVVLCCLLSSLVLGNESVHPKDLDGWSKAKWGMSEHEIRSAFAPDAKKLPNRVKHGDQYFDLVLNDFKVGQVSFTVRFLMDEKSNRLVGVSLESEGGKLSPELFWALENGLVQNYGPPNHRSKGIRLLAEWIFPSSTIEMLYGDSPLAGRFIYLTYSSTAETTAQSTK